MRRGDILPCGHTDLTLLEMGRGYTVHEREPDGRWYHHSGEDNYTGIIEITCRDCGRHWQFGQNANRPRWAHELWRAATTPDKT